MQIETEDGQVSWFGQDGLCGKTSPEVFPAGSLRGKTSASSCNRSRELVSIPYLSLDLTPGNGNLLGEFYWETLSPWLGGSSTLNTGASPRDVLESTLSQILQAGVPTKYYLTKRACLGILRRAAERGKPLPPQLEIALYLQAGVFQAESLPKPPRAFHINQREEVIDLGETAGALLATVNMQMQTFISQERLSVNDRPYEGKEHPPLAFAINQRKEVRDLGTVSAALTATQGMEMQTFISQGQYTAGFCAGAGASAGGIGYTEELAPTLKASPSGNMMPSVLCLNDQGGKLMDVSENCTGTLRAQEHGHQPLIFDNHSQDCRWTGPLDVSPTICAGAGEGGNNLPFALEQNVVGTLCARDSKGADNIYAEQNKLVVEGPMIFDNHGPDCRYTGPLPVSPTICARAGEGGNNLPFALEQEVIGTLAASDCKGVNSQYVAQDKLIVEGPYLIRRLVPLECELLQGYPPGWTDLVGASDTSRYKALGNSIAVPCAEFILGGISGWAKREVLHG